MDYQKGKIYKIESHLGDKIYVGSTTKEYLSQRMASHRKDYNLWKKEKKGKLTSFELFDEYGIDNCNIILIELYPCTSKDELHSREAHFIRALRCVNKMVPGRTQKEYREVNKEMIKAKDKIYNEANKDIIKEKRKISYEKNKDALLEKQREYREQNQERRKATVNKYFEKNKDIINQKSAMYYEANKELIKEKSKIKYAEKKLLKQQSL